MLALSPIGDSQEDPIEEGTNAKEDESDKKVPADALNVGAPLV
jgi:hypothetical protein